MARTKSCLSANFRESDFFDLSLSAWSCFFRCAHQCDAKMRSCNKTLSQIAVGIDGILRYLSFALLERVFAGSSSMPPVRYAVAEVKTSLRSH